MYYSIQSKHIRKLYIAPLLRRHIAFLWSTQWNNLPVAFATKYKAVVSSIPYGKTWFDSLDLPRSIIVRFNRLRKGHTLLPDYAHKFGLNNSPLCNLHMSEDVCDISHLLFDCPSLYTERASLVDYVESLDISYNRQPPLLARFPVRSVNI